MASRLLSELKKTIPFARLDQEALVAILRGAGPPGLCGREVGERLIAQVPDVPRLLGRMERQGLLHRQRDPTDRRHVNARLSERGLERLAAADAVAEAPGRGRFAALSEPALRKLLATLDTVRSPG